MKNLYIGLMSGTSMDGVDAALVSFDNTIQLLGTASIEIPPHIKSALLTLCCGENIHLKLLGETDTQMGHLFADAVLNLLEKTAVNPAEITAIGSHGQTIYHHPNSAHPFTSQIGDPNIIAARTNITTVADFRRRDIALGGQGAPLVPAFHEYLFRDRVNDCCVVNIGGIANITYLPGDKTKSIMGFDTGPGNTLIDQWHQKHRGKPIDFDGGWARSGKINQELLTQLLDDPYFKLSSPKSTGREYFNLKWVAEKLKIPLNPPFSKGESEASLDLSSSKGESEVLLDLSSSKGESEVLLDLSFSGERIGISSADIQATLTELTAKSIAYAINHSMRHDKSRHYDLSESRVYDLWVCGGGAYNQYLVERLRANLPCFQVISTTQVGIDPQWIEAAAFAFLAKQTIEKKPGNCINVTGARKETILGAVFPV